MARTTAATTDHAAPVAGPLIPQEAGRWLSDLFEEHGRMVYGVCRILLRDPQDAEDASQQTFLSAHRSLLAGTRPQDPAAWLGTIARNECRERIRSRATVPLALVGDPAASMQLEDVTGRREEIEASARHSQISRTSSGRLSCCASSHGLSYDEVRAALGVTDSAVESLIFRARKRLQKELRPARMASGALVLPIALHDSLAHAVPGFAGAHRVGILAKLVGAPLAAKLAAATLTVAAVGVMGATTVGLHRRAPAAEPGIVAKTPSAPSPFVGDADLDSTPGTPNAPATDPSHSNDQGKGHKSSSGGPEAGDDQDAKDEAADTQDGDENQSSVAESGDENATSGAEDGDDMGAGDNGPEDSSGTDDSSADSSPHADDDPGSSATEDG
jgi:RNA polymerase sigma factor (sigma-70 family)